MKKKGNKKIVVYAVMLFVCMISLLPIIWVFVSSLKTNQEILASSFALPKAIYLGGYEEALSKVNIPARFLNSLIITSVSTLVGISCYAMSAYVLARKNFKGKNLLFGLFISSMLIPGNALLQPIFLIMNKLGLYDQKAGLMLVYIGFGMPISLFLMRSFFLQCPKEMEESAAIEGAGFFRTFWSIMLPLAKPAICSAAILMFIGNWNELIFALLLTSSEKNRTLPLTMKFFTTTFGFDYSAMFAALVMCIIPTILVYIVLQRQIMESMIAGAVKG